MIDSDLATRTLFVEHEDGMLCGAVAEVASIRCRRATLSRLSAVARPLVSHPRLGQARGVRGENVIEPVDQWRAAASYDAARGK